MKTLNEFFESKTKDKKEEKIEPKIKVEFPTEETIINPAADTSKIILMLKNAFAEEMLAYYQYIMLEYFACQAPIDLEKDYEKIVKSIIADFKKNAKDELEDHAYSILDRLKELGSDFVGIENPSLLDQVAMHKYIVPTDVNNILTCVEQVAQAERDAIETYTHLVEVTEETDKDTNKLVKRILKDEEKHLKDMEEFIKKINDYREKASQETEKKED